jgi:hypothetical protein
MASSTTSPAPSPATKQPMPTGADYKAWEPPNEDQEFVFESVDAAPSWIDKGWASFDRGPALAVPAGDMYGTGPYHTQIARVGDKVVFTKAKGASPAKITVIPGEPDPKEGKGTKKIPAVTNASLEDMLKTGVIGPDQLGDDAKAQVSARTPALKTLIEEGKGAPEKQSAEDLMKLD